MAGLVAIDTAEFLSVRVKREWQNIDLLIEINAKDEMWAIVIENKVWSTQYSGQLNKYKQLIESNTKYKKRMYIFLTKNNEKPSDSAYVPASYEQVYSVLKESIEECEDTIANQPRVLLDNYLDILRENFMSDSEVKKLATDIYEAHKLAIDTIINHLPNYFDQLSETICKKIDNIDGLTSKSSDKNFVRFIPKEWDTEGNRRGGQYWGENSCSILCEVVITNKRFLFKILAGHPEDDWVDDFKKLKPGDIRESKGENYPLIYKNRGGHSREEPNSQNIEKIADDFLSWILEEIKSEEFVNINKKIIEFLPRLEKRNS